VESHLWHDDEGDRGEMKGGADEGHELKDLVVAKNGRPRIGSLHGVHDSTKRVGQPSPDDQ
jgi:hypothetical protein